MSCEKLGPALDDLAKAFRVDDDASPVSQNNLLAVEFIEILRDLLARGADNIGQRLVTDGQGDQGPTRVGCSKTIRQIPKLKCYPSAHVEADAANAMDIRLPVQMQGRDEPWEKTLIRGADKGFDENLWFDGTYRRGLKGVAPERVARFGHERVEAEKLSRRNQADNRLPLITVVRDSDDSRDEQVNEPGLRVLIENHFIFLKNPYGQISGEPVQLSRR